MNTSDISPRPGGTSKAAPPLIAVIEKNRSRYWERVNAGFAEAAGLFGMHVDISAPRTEDTDEQLSLMATALDSDADAVAVVGTTPDGFNDLIERGIAGGTPVVTFDLDAPDSSRHLYVGTQPPHDLGRQAGNAMARRLGAGSRVAVQSGSTHAAGAFGKMAGFREVMAARGIDVVECRNDMGDSDAAYSIVLDILRDDPTIAGLYGVYAYHAPVQARAVSQMRPQGTVHVVGNDMLPETVAGIQSGTIACSLWIQEYYFGFYTVSVLANMLRIGPRRTLTLMGFDGMRGRDRRLVLPPIEYTSANVAEYVTWEKTL